MKRSQLFQWSVVVLMVLALAGISLYFQKSHADTPEVQQESVVSGRPSLIVPYRFWAGKQQVILVTVVFEEPGCRTWFVTDEQMLSKLVAHKSDRVSVAHRSPEGEHGRIVSIEVLR